MPETHKPCSCGKNHSPRSPVPIGVALALLVGAVLSVLLTGRAGQTALQATQADDKKSEAGAEPSESAKKFALLYSQLEQACAKKPNDTDASLTLATWQTWLGHDADYEAARHRLIQQAEGTDQAGTAERAAKSVCIRPCTDAALLTNALKFAQQAAEMGKTSRLLPWYQLTLGLAQFRNGQFADAEKTLAVAEKRFGAYPEMLSITRFYRVTSIYRQNRPEEARTLFNQAESQMPPLPPDEQHPMADGKLVSHDHLICWMAYKEAKSMFDNPAAKKK